MIEYMLSIDPGLRTGYARIEFGQGSERVTCCGPLKQTDTYFSSTLRRLAKGTRWLVVEAQYLDPKKPRAALAVSRSRGLVLGVLCDMFWPERVAEINPQQWQAAYGIKGRHESRKIASLRIARSLVDGRTEGFPLESADAADAALMGLYWARQVTAELLKIEARSQSTLL
ncbi:MAG: hypothetical protein WC455_14650 [Dehalococcoidia bacterium]|jgi:hypothetical protein